MKMKPLLLITTLTAATLIAPAAAVATEERTLTESVEDVLLATQVKASLLTDLGFDALAIDVTARGNEVTLAGTVDKRTTAEQSQAVAKAVDGVAKVHHHVRVEPKPSGTPVADAVAKGEREVADALLESKVKMALLSELGKNAFDLEVEATDGTVSLRGQVAEASHEKLALKTAEKCDGVSKVIDLIES